MVGGSHKERAFNLRPRDGKLLKSGSRWGHPGQQRKLRKDSVPKGSLGTVLRGGGYKVVTSSINIGIRYGDRSGVSEFLGADIL